MIPTTLLLALLTPAAASAATAPEQDASGPLAAVERLFDGMRAADPAMIREVLAPDVRFAVLDDSGGALGIGVESLVGWLGGVGASSGRWDERIYDVEVKQDGAMASVWAPYTFYLDGDLLHCGVNSIELLRDSAGVEDHADQRHAPHRWLPGSGGDALTRAGGPPPIPNQRCVSTRVLRQPRAAFTPD